MEEFDKPIKFDKSKEVYDKDQVIDLSNDYDLENEEFDEPVKAPPTPRSINSFEQMDAIDAALGDKRLKNIPKEKFAEEVKKITEENKQKISLTDQYKGIPIADAFVKQLTNLGGWSDEAKGRIEQAGQAIGVKGAGGSFGEMEFQKPLLLEPNPQEKLLAAYKERKALSEQQKEQAFKDQPLASIAGMVTQGAALSKIPGIGQIGAAKKIKNIESALAMLNAAKGTKNAASALAAAEKVANPGVLKAMAELGLTGTAGGALYGLGSSKADLTKGEVKQALDDTLFGAEVGGLLGGSIPIVGKTLQVGGEGLSALGNKAASALRNQVNNVNAATRVFKEAFKGNKILDKIMQLNKDLTGQIKEITNKTQTQLNKLAQGKKEIITKADESVGRVDLTNKIDDMIKNVENINAIDPIQIKAKNDYLDTLRNMRDGVRVVKNVKEEVVTQGKQQEKALEQISKKRELDILSDQDKQNIAEQKLLQREARSKAINPDKEFAEPQMYVDPQTGKQVMRADEMPDDLMSLVQSGEAKVASSGKMVGPVKPMTLLEDVIPSNATEIKVMESPSGYKFAEYKKADGNVVRQILPENVDTTKVKTKRVEEFVGPGSKMLPSELQDSIKALKRMKKSAAKDSEVYSRITRDISDLESLMEGYASGTSSQNKQISDVLKAYRTLTGKELKDVKFASSVAKDEPITKVADDIIEMADETGEETLELLSQPKQVSEISPQMNENIKNYLLPSQYDAPRAESVSSAVSSLGKSVPESNDLIRNLMTTLENLNITESVVPSISSGKALPQYGGLRGVGLNIMEMLGTMSKKAVDTTKAANKKLSEVPTMSEMVPNVLKPKAPNAEELLKQGDFGKQLLDTAGKNWYKTSTENLVKLSKRVPGIYEKQLMDAAMSSDVQRQAILHSLYKQPMFRNAIKDFNDLFTSEDELQK